MSVWFPIRADFARALVADNSGYGMSWEMVGAAMQVGDDPAARLLEKLKTSLGEQDGLDLSLWLEDDEADALASAGQNCATEELPEAQRRRLDARYASLARAA